MAVSPCRSSRRPREGGAAEHAGEGAGLRADGRRRRLKGGGLWDEHAQSITRPILVCHALYGGERSELQSPKVRPPAVDGEAL